MLEIANGSSNTMKLEKLTQKTREALEEAINHAQDLNNQQVELEHLFYALLKQTGGVVLKENINKILDIEMVLLKESLRWS